MLEDLNRDRPFDEQVVLTPFWVVAGPDYEAMRETGCPVCLCRARRRREPHMQLLPVLRARVHTRRHAQGVRRALGPGCEAQTHGERRRD